MYLSRYALRALDGAWVETTADRTWDRVSGAIARPEKDRALWRREFRKLLGDFKFVPAGRILFGAQNPRASTLFNCYFIPVREDSRRRNYPVDQRGLQDLFPGRRRGYEHRRAPSTWGARAQRRHRKFRLREFHGSIFDGHRRHGRLQGPAGGPDDHDPGRPSRHP